MNPSFHPAVPRSLRNAVLAVCLGITSASAQTSTVPVLMSYQGRVTDASGVLIGNTTPANRSVTFRLYSASSGGSAMWAETQTATISGGEFSVLIGNGTGLSGTPGPSAPASTPYKTLSDILTAATTASLYLGITVDDGNASTADAEIAPRQQLVSGAYALRSRVAETVASGAVTSTMIGDGAVTTNQISAGAVNNAKIADTSVTTAKVADSAVVTAKLADASVTTAKLVNGNVTSDKIADGTIATADLADSAVNSAKILDGAVTTSDIADGTILTNDLAASSVDLGKLVAAVQQALSPVGTVVAFAGDTAPSGWMLCNGSSISRTTYSALYAVVANRFGSADASNFNVPDFRGRFLRGRDGGVGRDEDRNSRAAMAASGATGDAVGSVQDDLFKSHNHSYSDIYFSENTGGTGTYTNGKGSGDSDTDNEPWEIGRTSGSSGGNETRPENANVNYIIKY